jgi:hypothetical protein
MELLRDEGHVESHFGPFGCKIGAQFAPNVPLAQKTLWTHPMVLLGDKAQLECCFSPFADSANLDVGSVHGLCRTYHRLRNHC